MRFQVKVAERIIIIAFKMNGTLLLDGAPIHAGTREAVDAQLIIIFEAEMAMRRALCACPDAVSSVRPVPGAKRAVSARCRRMAGFVICTGKEYAERDQQ